MAKITPFSEIVERQYVHRSGMGSGTCPGCGGGITAQALARAIDRLGIDGDRVAFIQGVTCSGGSTRFLNYSRTGAPHGRAAAMALGLKLARPDLTVIAIQGDGDALAIGGNHFIHAARRNVDITIVINNNFTYGRTGGQYGPTTPKGARATSAPFGTIEESLNPCALAEAAGATFVARGTTYHVVELINIFEKAIQHHGCSVVEVITQCPVSFGRYNPDMMGRTAPKMLQWMRDNVISIDKAKKMKPEKFNGKFVRGIFVDKESPNYGGDYQKIIEKAQKGNKE
jgi:2-oxoglutarate ferredoxin oxidoreductase subunit beta